MTILKNTRVLLVSRPTGNPTKDNFKIDDQSTVDTESLKENEILVKTHYLSLDPYLLMPMGKAGVHGAKVENQSSYPLKQFKGAMNVTDLGDCFGGRGVGRVIASKHDSVSVGDWVAADWGWQEYALFNVNEEFTFEKLESEIFGSGQVSLSTALGILSVSGSHALWGYNFCETKPGQTMVISAAGGNIGIIVSQLAKLNGVRVVGIAGGADKCEKLKKELDIDAVVDYRQGNNDVQKLTELIREACPNGIDAYFDNVGGIVTNAVDNVINENAHVYICGAVSQYAHGQPVQVAPRSAGIYKEKNVVVTTCMTADYISKIPEARRELFALIKEGKLRPVEWIVDGIENTPAAFVDMYGGKNFGKSLIKVFSE